MKKKKLISSHLRKNRLQKLLLKNDVTLDTLGVLWGTSQQVAQKIIKTPAKINLQQYLLLAMKLNIDFYELIKIALHDVDWDAHLDYTKLQMFKGDFLTK